MTRVSNLALCAMFIVSDLAFWALVAYACKRFEAKSNGPFSSGPLSGFDIIDLIHNTVVFGVLFFGRRGERNFAYWIYGTGVVLVLISSLAFHFLFAAPGPASPESASALRDFQLLLAQQSMTNVTLLTSSVLWSLSFHTGLLPLMAFVAYQGGVWFVTYPFTELPVFAARAHDVCTAAGLSEPATFAFIGVTFYCFFVSFFYVPQRVLLTLSHAAELMRASAFTAAFSGDMSQVKAGKESKAEPKPAKQVQAEVKQPQTQQQQAKPKDAKQAATVRKRGTNKKDL